MKWIYRSTLVLFFFTSCESTPREEKFIRNYINNNYTVNENNSCFIFVTEFDCIECVQRINKFIEIERNSNSGIEFYGEYLKLQKFGNSEIENILLSETQIKWRFIKNTEIFNYLSEVSRQISGPFAVSFNSSGSKVKVLSI
jgi:hypothetical protein